MSELNAFRAEKDEFFGGHPQSPLTREQRKDFHGLQYFPENDSLRLEVKVDEFENKQKFEMQTSTGDVQVYEKFGKFSFEAVSYTHLDVYKRQLQWWILRGHRSCGR